MSSVEQSDLRRDRRRFAGASSPPGLSESGDHQAHDPRGGRRRRQLPGSTRLSATASSTKTLSTNWLYEAEAEPELGGHKSYQPRGKVLGGTGSINGMIYMRGHPEDFAHWQALGNVGWGYEDVLPYYRKSEENARGPSRFHGNDGPVRVLGVAAPRTGGRIHPGAEQAGFPRQRRFQRRGPRTVSATTR
jgi:choline dehydrogenase-like flavoprotein